MPDLNPPAAGLRRLWNNSKQPSKVQVAIPPGDVLEVSEALAEQLAAQDPHLQDAPAQQAEVVHDATGITTPADTAEQITKAVKGKRVR
jgi:hypothetical protein